MLAFANLTDRTNFFIYNLSNYITRKWIEFNDQFNSTYVISKYLGINLLKGTITASAGDVVTFKNCRPCISCVS